MDQLKTTQCWFERQDGGHKQISYSTIYILIAMTFFEVHFRRFNLPTSYVKNSDSLYNLLHKRHSNADKE